MRGLRVSGYIKILRDKSSFFAFFLSSMIWFTPLRTFLIEVGNEFLPGTGRVLSRISILIFFIYLIYPVFRWVRVTKDCLLILIFILFQWGRPLIFYTEHISTWISVLVDFLIKVFPFYVIARQTTDWNLVKQKLYQGSIIAIVLMAVMTIIKMEKGNLFHENATYSMFWGFLMGRPSTVMLVAFLDTKKIKYLLMFIISMPFVILYGTRTPLVCVFFALFLYLLVVMEKSVKEHKVYFDIKNFRLLYLLFLILIIVIAYALRSGRERTTDVLSSGQRIIYIITNGGFLKSDGRINIYKICIDLIMESPCGGVGILSDRVKIAEQFGGGFIGTYAHNIILEWLLQFGIIVGGILLLGLGIICWKLLFRTKDRDKRTVSIYLVGFGMSFLMLSGTAFDCCELYVLLGMGLGSVRVCFRGRCFLDDFEKNRTNQNLMLGAKE